MNGITWGDSKSSGVRQPSCYESHPVLKMGKGKLIGGSAANPMSKDADVYVSLQKGSTSSMAGDPWEKKPVIEIHYGITDQHAPSNLKRYQKMVEWLCNQLQEGKTIHVGCIGGHGRTGTLLAAIVATIKEEKDAIGWVRKHYCAKAVESQAQVDFLVKHFGVKTAKPRETKFLTGGTSSRTFRGSTGFSSGVQQEIPMRVEKPVLVKGVTKDTRSFQPLSSSRCIWRKA